MEKCEIFMKTFLEFSKTLESRFEKQIPEVCVSVCLWPSINDMQKIQPCIGRVDLDRSSWNVTHSMCGWYSVFEQKTILQLFELKVVDILNMIAR